LAASRIATAISMRKIIVCSRGYKKRKQKSVQIATLNARNERTPSEVVRKEAAFGMGRVVRYRGYIPAVHRYIFC
jgi:hypothetical protein